MLQNTLHGLYRHIRSCYLNNLKAALSFMCSLTNKLTCMYLQQLKNINGRTEVHAMLPEVSGYEIDSDPDTRIGLVEF